MFNNFITNLDESDIFGKALMNLDKEDQDAIEKRNKKYEENDFDDIEDFEDDFGEFDAMAEARKELRLDGSEEDEKNPWDYDDEDDLAEEKEDDSFYDYEYLDDDEDKFGEPKTNSNKRYSEEDEEEDLERPKYNPFIGGLL